MQAFKKAICLSLSLLLLLVGSAASGETAREHVFYTSEVEMFPEGTETLDLYVAPLLGADSMVVLCGGEAMLVDTGKPTNYADVHQMLEDLGLHEFKYFYNTHPHDDHLGALDLILQDYQVDEFISPFPRDFSYRVSHHRTAVAAAEKAGVPFRQLTDGETFTLGSAQIVMHQTMKFDDLNQMSGVLKITFGDRSLLLTGDCSEWAGKLLSETYDLHAEILKYPHHGIGLVFKEFIENVSPEFAIIPHGYLDTVKNQMLLNRYHIPFGFATWGVIHAATDGNIWIVEQTLNANGINMMKQYGSEPGIWK